MHAYWLHLEDLITDRKIILECVLQINKLWRFKLNGSITRLGPVVKHADERFYFVSSYDCSLKTPKSSAQVWYTSPFLVLASVWCLSSVRISPAESIICIFIFVTLSCSNSFHNNLTIFKKHGLQNLDNITRHLFSSFQPSVNQTVIIQEVTVSGQENAGNTTTYQGPL
jgi:hypothetical protein